MIVVSDTSPIRALGNLGLLDLLPQLYRRVVVPRAVALELSQVPAGHFQIDPDDLAAFSGVTIASAADDSLVKRFLVEPDGGESEALALAVELRADLILIDEAAGRAAARREGLNVLGVLGLLLEAKHRGLVEVIAPLLDQLQTQYQFFIGPHLRTRILEAAGE